MPRVRGFAIKTLLFWGAFFAAAWSGRAQEIGARIRIDRGNDPVLQRGERVRLYYAVDRDAYVAVFQIDTDGRARLLHPRSPDESNLTRGGRESRLLFPRSSYWHVDDDPGVGFFFILASPVPLDLESFRYSYERGGWDLTPVGARVYGDPYAAMDDLVEFMLPDWELLDYGLDFAEYNVERRHEYPRFLCYDCHGYRSYSSWNPYLSYCTDFRVVIYDDPFFYPSNRYRGDRVVFVTPRPNRPRYVFKERADGEPGTPAVLPRPREVDRRTQPHRRTDVDRATQPRRSAPERLVPISRRGDAVAGSRGRVATPSRDRRDGVSGGSGFSGSTSRSTRTRASAQPTRPAVDRSSLRGSNSSGRGSSARSATPVRRVVPSRSSSGRRTLTRSNRGSSRGSSSIARPRRSGGSSVKSAPARSSGSVRKPSRGSGSRGSVKRSGGSKKKSGGGPTRPKRGGGGARW